MKRIITRMALALSTTAAIAQTPKAEILPDSFVLQGAVTSSSIKTLFAADSNGMYLSPAYLLGADSTIPQGQYEIGIEVVGYTGRHPTNLSFGISQVAYSGDTVIHRIAMFNYTTETWDTVAWASADAPALQSIAGRPYLAPFTYAEVKAKDYIDPEIGEVRTRVYWSSTKPFRTIWIDYTGWQYSWN